MIHKMDNAKRKPEQHHDSGFIGNEYLTDDDLMKLIGQVETAEMLHAPKQLKGNVFAQIHRERRKMKKRQVFVYRAKVLVAMAAAFAALILTPEQNAANVQEIFIQEQNEDESLELMALRRYKSRELDWEKYVEEQERGGVRGFLNDLNQKMSQFGTDLYYNITT